MAGLQKIVASKKAAGVSSWVGGEPKGEGLAAMQEHLAKLARK